MRAFNLSRINSSFFVLIILATVVAFIFFALFFKAFFLHLASFNFCQSTTWFLGRWPHIFLGGIMIFLGTILVIGVFSFLVQLRKTDLLIRRFSEKRVVFDQRMYQMEKALKLNNKIWLTRDENLFSFCFGIFSPKIIITTALADSLSKKELEAVLLHEKSHLKNIDPSKLILGKTFSLMFFFLPIFQELHKNITTNSELMADQYAANIQQGTLFLRGAIKKILLNSHMNTDLLPSIVSQDNLETRINRLTNPGTKITLKLSYVSLISSLVFVILGLDLLQTPVQAFKAEEDIPTAVCDLRGTSDCYKNCLDKDPTVPDYYQIDYENNP